MISTMQRDVKQINTDTYLHIINVYSSTGVVMCLNIINTTNTPFTSVSLIEYINTLNSNIKYPVSGYLIKNAKYYPLIGVAPSTTQQAIAVYYME